jgi:chaperonin GroEL
MSFETADLDVVGTARKVIVGKDDTTIIEGAGRPADISARIAQIRTQAENASSEYDKEQLEKRAAALSGKVAVIKVGGASETEIEEKKFRVDDAVAAVKAALAEGVVPGGGVTLVNLAKMIEIDTSDAIKSADPGRGLLIRTLKQPFYQITSNAGLNADALLAQVESAKNGMGINVNSPEKGLVDMKAAGVVDPVAVTRQAIESSVSIAGTAITMGTLVVEIPKEDPPMPAGGGGGMGMPGMM